jgi:hypothetical protein
MIFDVNGPVSFSYHEETSDSGRLRQRISLPRSEIFPPSSGASRGTLSARPLANTSAKQCHHGSMPVLLSDSVDPVVPRSGTLSAVIEQDRHPTLPTHGLWAFTDRMGVKSESASHSNVPRQCSRGESDARAMDAAAGFRMSQISAVKRTCTNVDRTKNVGAEAYASILLH